MMGNITRAANHLTVEQVKEHLKEAKEARQLQRWLIVYTALVAPRKAAEMAASLGVSISLVQKVISLYNRGGAHALEIKGCGGRYHEYLTKEEERAFLATFFEQAERGELATTKEIQLAYEARVGHKVHETTIYRLLDRGGWRKLMPRPRHPQADPQAQEQFKKNLRRRLKKPSRGESPLTVDQ
jgi:transposase